MQTNSIESFYKSYADKITQRSFLGKIKISKRDMLEHMRSENWKSQTLSILQNKSVLCVDVLLMCKNVMDRLSDPPKEGWLLYLYYHLVCRIYPEYADDPMKYQNVKYDAALFFYLETMRAFLAYENTNAPFDNLKHFDFLAEEEAQKFDGGKEYEHFMQLYHDNYIYEMMRIGREATVFNILSHIAGVHFVAMHIAKQLYAAGEPIDLAVTSGAALGHDIGKFGCKPSESGRVPYLHYYYTDQWFRQNQMPAIGHIAANHSAWDLELENLPIESLVLIYADFRVKNKFKNSNEYNQIPSQETIEFHSLTDSFDVILNKLDNVDKEKHRRYNNVYSKLYDFEKYMESLGINTDLSDVPTTKPPIVDPALRSGEEVIQSLKYLAIEHNIRVMSKISSDASFANILEAARSEKNWKNIRAYINIFSEYFTYMTQKQKILTLDFLYELLMHKEGDIRRQVGALIGEIITQFDEKYRKEIPAHVILPSNEITALFLWEKYLGMILRPDHKVTDKHRRWIGHALRVVVHTTLQKCKEEDKQSYFDVFLSKLQDQNMDDLTVFILLDSMRYIPLSLCRRADLLQMAGFALSAVNKGLLENQVNALNFIRYASRRLFDEKILIPEITEIISHFRADEEICINYLKYQILQHLKLPSALAEVYKAELYGKPSHLSAIFLNNLKMATPWILKIINIEFLLEMLKLNRGDLLHVAAHLSNLIKVSERVTVRHTAGGALLSIVPMLTSDQCNEIAIELLKGLEIGDYAVCKYIPQYLGEIALYLPPREFEEMLGDLNALLKGASEKAATGALNTLSIMLEHYQLYKDRFLEDAEVFEKRKQVMLGMILGSLSNYNDHINQEAFLVLGKNLFGSKYLTVHQLHDIFIMIYKKMLTLISTPASNELTFFNNATSLNHIYRFISNYTLAYGGFSIAQHKKVAYFPGTFDPFSLSHKGIVQEIRNLGYEVYLALDEFSWSKRTQPRLIRWQIANMSVADEFNVYLFPDEIPVNISNNNDISTLKSLFSGRELYFVAGSDVIMNASAYKSAPTPDSIHSLNHIVFRRSSVVYTGDAELEVLRRRITGELVELTLPLHLEDISSTSIRDHIDNNRDISNLIDPLSQNYIYDLGLYLREPQYKSMLKTRSARFTLLDREKAKQFLIQYGISYIEKNSPHALIMESGGSDGRMLGFALYHELTASDLYDEFGSSFIAEYVRNRSCGKILVIHHLHRESAFSHENIIQFLLTEALARCLENNFCYALYRVNDPKDETALDVMKLQGFSEIQGDYEGGRIYAVNMAAPIVLIKDVEQVLKEPLRSNPQVQTVIEESHQSLQSAMVKTYPGNLVLSFDGGIMNHGIVDKVTSINQVPSEPLPVRKLGGKICVPFGKILRGVIVPNTVTKSLHTEKMFDAEIHRFSIDAYPFYSPLANQVRTIRSFNRNVVLVDDILHKGYRLKELDPIFKTENLLIDRIVVGIMSGRGKDLMQIQERKAESVYYLPNLRIWFTESALYPFIGGDTVKRDNLTQFSAPPSVNLILPYVSPNFIRGASLTALFSLSMTCLENTRKLLLALETEYRQLFERNLTLNRLGDVMMYPRCPDTGNQIKYDYNLAPSVYIENDIEKLIRLWGLIR